MDPRATDFGVSRHPGIRASDAMPQRKRRTSPPPTETPPKQAAGAAKARRVVSQPEAPAQIQIDIDPAVTAGYIRDRYDLLVRGRAICSLPIEEVTLSIEDRVAGRVQFGPSAPSSIASDDGSLLYAFHVNVPLQRSQASGTCTCIVAARAQGGLTHEQSFELVVEPTKSMPVSVASGPTRSAQSYGHVRPPVVLYVEQAMLDDNRQLVVRGWAVSSNPMVAIQLFMNDERIGAAQIGGSRDDVGAAFPGYPNGRNSGFTFSRHFDDRPMGDVSAVRVQAISREGFVHEAVLPVERVHAVGTPAVTRPPPAPDPMAALSPTLQQPTYRLEANFHIGPDLPSLQFVPTNSFATAVNSPLAAPVPPPAAPAPVATALDPRRTIRYFCDQLELDPDGNLSALGWAVCSVGIASITVYLDDEMMGEAELGLARPDVGEEFRQIPMARFSGFEFSKALGELPVGEHRIGVVLRNGLDDMREEIRTVLVERAEPPPPPPAIADPMQFRIEIDTPTVVAGAAVDPVTGRLTIEGWALARSGISSIEVLLDDQRLGDAHYGLARQDVGTAFPDWTDSLRSGYAFHCPPRSLRNGDHVVQLNVRARSGEVLEHRFTINVRKAEEFEDGLTIRRRITQVEADVAQQVLDRIGHRPGFRLILRQDADLAPRRLLTTIGSLRSQAYRDWRLEILTGNADTATAISELLAEAANDLLDRIDVIVASTQEQPLGSADDATTLRLVGFLSPGDELGCDALLRMAVASGLRRNADLLYADEVRVSPASRERETFFKPDFSPDLLLSTNYIGRPWFASTGLLGRAGVTGRDLMEVGEYDAVLRCTEHAVSIHHVPDLLCQRGTQQIDDAELEAGALARAALRRGFAADVHVGAVPGTWRMQRKPPVSGLVSIIIPTCAARGFIETCIKSLRERTAYRNVEIVCVDNIPDDQMAWKIWLQQNADVVVPMPDAFNWSHFNNRGAEASSGEYLLFLNDDIEVTQPEWLDAMLEHVQRPEVAVVGPQLLYPDSKVQHAGMFLATRGTARHAFRFAPADDPGYFGLALTQRNVIAVTGACMLMRRSLFESLGRFEEAHEIINNDLDFCLRAHRAGKLIVYTPYASLVHHEAASRDRLKDVFDLGHFEERWNTLFAAGDPFFSPRLSRHSDDYRPDDEPVEAIYAGHPLFRHADVKRILVVKVDHIGDFVTAIPAIRRMKQIFPAASIHVLASRAARAFAEIEDCIDEFHEFEFFHAVSGLGPKDISQEEYVALRERLTPYRFDIAVDLRKHVDTREVLRYTQARFLAGFDHMGQCSFLDISLEWEGDRNLQRKRSHVTDDLTNLVAAIGSAGATERTSIALTTPVAGPPDFLPDDVRELFDRPVVAVHPGVGSVMRQWPPEHFASLVDLLVQQNGVNAVLIGGTDEAELADLVLSQIANRGAVASLVGRTSLRQLPELLRACALYVGNNSGPKHIAAALGVPTIGIHSGVVDPVEWGPVGERAVAVRRDMTCSPCYLARMEDCPRGYACMNGLEPAAVHETAQILLARPVPRPRVEAMVEQQRPIAASPEPLQPVVPAKKPRRSRKRQAATVSAE